MKKATKPSDDAITRRKVRDGIIVAEMVDIDFSAPAAQVIAALKQVALFQSSEERIAVHRRAAQEVIDSGVTGSRRKYAQNAVLYFDWALDHLHKIADSDSRKHANDAIVDLIRAFESAWRVDVKEIEPVVVTGALLRKGGDKGRKARQDAANPIHEQWRKVATAARAKNPALSNSDIARRIDPVRWETIRKVIARK